MAQNIHIQELSQKDNNLFVSNLSYFANEIKNYSYTECPNYDRLKYYLEECVKICTSQSIAGFSSHEICASE